MDEKRIVSLLGIGRRANKVVFGKEQLRSYLRQPFKRKFLILACDTSDSIKEDWIKRCKSHGASCILLKEHDRVALGRAIGKENISAVAVADNGLADEISKIMTQAGGD
ncbi:MAG: ribosomal L7Ae/L30e/S12e/Gadd45 family protein [Mesotoga sp.]|jgi:ribosomal protein L7Ae-like RNA K-turn-binding protein|uniref:L7Ae/L30e/S12e/Gadd45 family ribosomal protein n=1 Tax=unclassified Mesotoga TaxID=1184398 RepID=UPI000EF25AA6|nr:MULTISPECIES: ribosomal L7Ae/L30e/S12e/Gadd45 family protein [unclassified Mesotoga]MDI9369258.1 ribosomal L7Ae/L30e/S12e/Gadd45 family protein [Thermotogota bacterium]NLT45510.1 50S ribosomal protein L7 [Thermotogaceae bacterium]MDD2334128.1 ribosomal L7Ae/L30e/S12e/Gadd45 family protein [Mesotoga sp.]MDD3680296.1 ribosomal L7Ae/L30e/S12e/Gadd45 family protein [Mesotoga sp.]MDD4206773.1 ribosomal L7Ae/L30e/S12e/Gadd45 family protein [Mesotoga sp.]